MHWKTTSRSAVSLVITTAAAFALVVMQQACRPPHSHSIDKIVAAVRNGVLTNGVQWLDLPNEDHLYGLEAFSTPVLKMPSGRVWGLWAIRDNDNILQLYDANEKLMAVRLVECGKNAARDNWFFCDTQLFDEYVQARLKYGECEEVIQNDPRHEQGTKLQFRKDSVGRMAEALANGTITNGGLIPEVLPRSSAWPAPYARIDSTVAHAGQYQLLVYQNEISYLMLYLFSNRCYAACVTQGRPAGRREKWYFCDKSRFDDYVSNCVDFTTNEVLMKVHRPRE